jgi:hypothetical protein
MIVTFPCSKSIHIFKVGRRPMFPYRIHDSIETAKKFLIESGIVEPKIIYV